MDIVRLTLICVNLICSCFVLVVRYRLVFLHNCVPRLPFRKKWPPIALSILHAVVLILLFVFVVLHFANHFRKAERNFETIEKFVEDFDLANNTAKNKLPEVIIPTIPPTQSRVTESQTLVMKLKKTTGFDDVEDFPEHSALSDYIQLLLGIQNNTKCSNIENSYISLINELMNGTLAVVDNLMTNMSHLRTNYLDLEVHLNTLAKQLNNELTIEKARMHSYATSLNSLFAGMVLSLRRSKTAIAEIMRQSNEIPFYIEELLTIYLPTILIFVFTLVSISHNINIFKSSWFSNFLHRVFYFLLFVSIALSLWQIEIFAKTYCPDEPLDILNVTVKAFKSNNPDDTIYANDALLNCSGTNENFFFARDSEIRISESIFIRNYKREFLEKAIKTFEYNHEFDEDVLFNATDKARNLYTNMDELNNKCFDANLKTEIETYRDALEKTTIYLNKTDKFREGLKNIHTTVPPLIDYNLRALTDPLSQPVNDISNILSETDFDCRSVVEAFSTGLNPCKLVNQSIKSWAQTIVIVCCALSAILYLLAIRRSDTKQFEFDNRQIWARMLLYRVKNPFSVTRVKLNNTELEKCEIPEEDLIKDPDSKTGKFQDGLNYECVNSTRVVLKNRPDDFIHASWVRIPEKKRSYIITQAPLKNTMTDFWAMCDQENVKTIVMFGQVEKKADYFPGEANQTGTYENFQVTCIEIKSHPVQRVVWRVIKLVNSLEVNSKPRMINHVQVLWWGEEKDIPSNPNHFLDLYRWVNKIHKGKSPICVQSHFGSGSAGTYVLFDYANARIRKDAECNTMSLLREIRKMRHRALCSAAQIDFFERCMINYLIQEGILESCADSEYFEAYKESEIEREKVLADYAKTDADVEKEVEKKFKERSEV